MKKYLTCLLLFILCFGCKKEHKLTFETLQLDNTTCSNCPDIRINVPHGLDNTLIAQNINQSIREELIYTLKFDDAEDVETIEGAMRSFTNSFQNLKEKFGDETMGWEAEINGEVNYEDEKIITIRLNSYSFTGGAHGYGSTTFLNFDKKNGTELENHQLFNDFEGFIDLAEQLFREKEQIPEKDNINSTGFMFNGEHFHLPENIGYNQKGIELIYNQYEVAPYADGPIILIVPFEKVNTFLKFKSR